MIKIIEVQYIGTVPSPGMFNEIVMDVLLPKCERYQRKNPSWSGGKYRIEYQSYVVDFVVEPIIKH